jgi:hypothetical protein
MTPSSHIPLLLLLVLFLQVSRPDLDIPLPAFIYGHDVQIVIRQRLMLRFLSKDLSKLGIILFIRLQ